jgi:hypothetical protein
MRPEVSVAAEGARLDAYVPAGRTELVVRALGGGKLSGALDLTATSVTPVGEGLGPEVLLAPGSSRMFSFETTQEAAVGVAVRASAGTVEVTLMDAQGGEIGRGVSQMPKLKPGRYLMALAARADGPTVRARAALAGLVRPDTGPPDDVARRYFAPEEERSAEFTATRSPTPWGMEAVEEGEGTESESEESAEEEPSEEDPPPDPESEDLRPLANAKPSPFLSVPFSPFVPLCPLWRRCPLLPLFGRS